MDIIGMQVKMEDGKEGTVVAVAHTGAGTGGWQLLILTEDKRLTAGGAVNARLVGSEGGGA